MLLHLAGFEQQIAREIEELRQDQASTPHDALVRRIEGLETKHTLVLERMLDLQRQMEPRPLPGQGRIG